MCGTFILGSIEVRIHDSGLQRTPWKTLMFLTEINGCFFMKSWDLEKTYFINCRCAIFSNSQSNQSGITYLWYVLNKMPVLHICSYRKLLNGGTTSHLIHSRHHLNPLLTFLDMMSSFNNVITFVCWLRC